MNNLSKNQLLQLLNSENIETVAAAEWLLGVCKYPGHYWIMPDYYYPGLLNNFVTKSKTMSTQNDFVLLKDGYVKTEYNKFIGNLYKIDHDIPKDIIFNEDETIEISSPNGNRIKIPFSTLCGIFLKAREMGYKRPSCLDMAGPEDLAQKERWMKNQEEILKLQSEIPEETLESLDSRENSN